MGNLDATLALRVVVAIEPWLRFKLTGEPRRYFLKGDDIGIRIA
ncbi:hypothetical protein QEH57_24230 [Pelagicoccus sp. SDUM812005]|nr:hypothetical protein [Pelagicoccus sp. SDUM812005]